MEKQEMQLLEEIAKKGLGIKTLETQASDELDFHEVSVWGVKEVLIKAYEAGREAGRSE